MSDRRRLLGPPNTILPNLGISPDINKIGQSSNKASDEIRKFFMKTGMIENANGSAYIEVGGNIVQVLVFGPRPIKGSFIERASFSVECKFLPHIDQPNEGIFNNDRSGGNSGNANNYRTGLTNIEQKISSYIETSLLPSVILEKYPKSTIDVFITIISVDSDNVSKSSNASLLNLINWIVNCSSVALVDSGIELKDIVSSGQAKLQDGEIILDSTGSKNDDDDEGIHGLVSFMNLRNDEIVGFWVEGDQSELKETELNKLIEGCNVMSKKLRANINAYLVEDITKSGN